MRHLEHFPSEINQRLLHVNDQVGVTGIAHLVHAQGTPHAADQLEITLRTAKQPKRISITSEDSKSVSWCFTPSQPVRLYQGESEDRVRDQRQQQHEEQG